MASDFEDDVLGDVDAICGWEGADFDDELLGRGRRRAAQAPAKGGTKRKPEKQPGSSSSGAALLPLGKAQQQYQRHQQQQQHDTSPDKIREVVDRAADKKDQPFVVRKPKRKHPHHEISAKPSPRTAYILEENAAIAALGRQRRMKVVAAAMAANVPRKEGIASVVSAYFEGGSDDEQTESDSLVPSSAPQKQQEKLPRVVEPSTAPARAIDPPKTNIHPPLPLPLLSINPNAGGNETRLSGKDKPASQAPRHWRRHRKQKKNSLLPSRYESEHWESNFPPSLRRFRSPRNYQAGSSDNSSSVVSSSFTSNVRAPLASGDVAQRTKELLPLIHHTTEGFQHVTVVDSVVDGDEAGTQNLREEAAEMEEGDDDNWTQCYDDPEAITKSMAGLIQALSTFAADGKKKRTSKAGKTRKRRAKLQRQQQQASANPPVLRLPQPGEMDVTSSISSISTGKQQENPTREHRKLPNSVAVRT